MLFREYREHFWKGRRKLFCFVFYFIVSFKETGTSTTSHLKHIMKLKLEKLDSTLILAPTDGSIHPVNAPPIILMLSVNRIGHNFPSLLPSLSQLLSKVFKIMSTYSWEGHMPWHAYGGWRITWQSWFSLSTMTFLGTKLGSYTWQQLPLPCKPSLQPPVFPFLAISFQWPSPHSGISTFIL